MDGGLAVNGSRILNGSLPRGVVGHDGVRIGQVVVVVGGCVGACVVAGAEGGFDARE